MLFKIETTKLYRGLTGYFWTITVFAQNGQIVFLHLSGFESPIRDHQSNSSVRKNQA